MILLQFFVICIVIGISAGDEWRVVGVGTVTCKQGCFVSRTRWCGGARCNDGVITQELRYCNYPKPCNGILTRTRVEKSCSGDCDRALETVTMSCSDPPLCSIIETRFCNVTCSGIWEPWSSFGSCSAPCGTKIRSRRCYDRTTLTPSFSCIGAKGQHDQSETAPCECPNSATVSETTPVDGQEVNGRSFPVDCLRRCSKTSKEIAPGALADQCTKNATETRGSCNKTVSYLVSCKGSLEQQVQSCVNLNVTIFCMFHLDWNAWSKWIGDSKDGGEHRYRQRWCNLPDPYINETTCRREMQLESQCRQITGAATSQQPDWAPWVLALVAFVLVVLFIILIVGCVARRRRKRKPARKNKSVSENFPPPPVELQRFPDEDAVFEVEQPLGTTGQRQQATDPNHLSVFQRFARASEHLYDSISARGSRLFSRSSEGSHWNDHQVVEHHLGSGGSATENEYIVSDGDEECQARKTKKRFETNNPLRISITVTDPEGMQVGSSVYKPQLTAENDAMQRKKRWSRVPSPTKEKPESKLHTRRYGGNENPHVQSVKYLDGTDIQVSQPKKERFRFRNLLKKLGASPKKSPRHDYDSVAKDEAVEGDDRSRPRVYLPSVSSAIVRNAEHDNASMWSESSFDDCDLPSPPPDVTSLMTPGKSARSKRSKSKTGSIPGRSGVTPIGGTKSTSLLSLDFPPPPQDKLPHEVDVRSPTVDRSSLSGQSSTRPGPQSHFVFPNASNQLNVQKNNTVDYLDMNAVHGNGAAGPFAGKNVSSRKRLGQTPMSGKELRSKKNVNLKLEAPGSNTAYYSSPMRCPTPTVRDLDEKYVTSIEVPRLQVSSDTRQFPTDKHGYIHLGFPE